MDGCCSCSSASALVMPSDTIFFAVTLGGGTGKAEEVCSFPAVCSSSPTDGVLSGIFGARRCGAGFSSGRIGGLRSGRLGGIVGLWVLVVACD